MVTWLPAHFNDSCQRIAPLIGTTACLFSGPVWVIKQGGAFASGTHVVAKPPHREPDSLKGAELPGHSKFIASSWELRCHKGIAA